MADDPDTGGGVLSPSDLCKWLESQSTEVLKAAELRIRDATEFVTRYATGEMTAREAMVRFNKYSLRWPDALPGVTMWPIDRETLQSTDEEILRRVDECIQDSHIKPSRGR